MSLIVAMVRKPDESVMTNLQVSESPWFVDWGIASANLLNTFKTSKQWSTDLTTFMIGSTNLQDAVKVFHAFARQNSLICTRFV